MEYFADAPGVLFAGKDYGADMERARGCWRHLRTMFQELEECRAFELLKVAPLTPVQVTQLLDPATDDVVPSPMLVPGCVLPFAEEPLTAFPGL